MPISDLLHGVETIRVDQSGKQIQAIKTAVIGIVGTADLTELLPENQTVNKLVLLNSEKKAAQFFGTSGLSTGFTLASSIDSVYDQKAGTILAINVCDPDIHKTEVVEEAITFVSGIANLKKHSILSATVKSPDSLSTYIENVDYSLTKNLGQLKVIVGGKLNNDTSVKVSYSYLDPSKVTAADIIGKVDPLTGERSGMQCWLDAYNTFAFRPKILIAPGFSSSTGVTAELEVLSAKLKAVSFVDAPAGMIVPDIIASRNPNGTINFKTISERVQLIYPNVKKYDLNSNTDIEAHSSAYFAGVTARTDASKGYWCSHSNKPIYGLTGITVNLSSEINTADSDVSLLNQAGIATVKNAPKGGYKTWGNRSASFPSNTTQMTFLCVLRTLDILEEALEQAAEEDIDDPGTAPKIDEICETGNKYIRTMIGRGVFLGGKVFIDLNENSADTLKAGKLTVSYEVDIPSPLEKITNKVILTNKYGFLP